jgi:nicotinamide phosphoribosyltransferase
MKILPILNSDSYKQFHFKMYPEGMTKLYSNMTPRSFARMGCDEAVWFGMQYYIREYLIDQWNEQFFRKSKTEVITQFKRFHKHFSFVDIDTTHVEKLHDLGYLPIVIKSLSEGTLTPCRVPFYTITNTHDDFAWLVNFLETQMSTVIWDLTTVATIAKMYRKIFDRWATKTVGNTDFVQWQGHDFSQRGRSSVESTFNQAGHLLSFTGTDTIPAVLMLEEYYGADITWELVGSSVPASEHSVMTSYGKENEIDAFKRILNQFPTGIVSVVSDSFDLWKVCTEYITEMREQIMARDGKLVIRPDSGDPVDIICGFTGDAYPGFDEPTRPSPSQKGVVELLWDVFGGTVNELGYKELDPHIGVIYGDAVTLERAEAICSRLAKKGFASTNVVFGIGSYTYNCNTRDGLGIAVKSTYCEVDGEQIEIFKDPVTDCGIKKSLRGLIKVYKDDSGKIVVKDRCTWEEESQGLLEVVFRDGVLTKETTLQQIRAIVNADAAVTESLVGELTT